MKTRCVSVTLTLLAAWFFSSCEKVIEFKQGETEPCVVIISKPGADSTVTVKMSYSRFFLDKHNFASVDNAALSLDVNGIVYSSINLDSGYYRFPVTVHEGDSLVLTATVPNYKHLLRAKTYIPRKSSFEVMEMEMDTTQRFYRSCQVFYRLRIRLKDLQKKGLYSIRVYTYDQLRGRSYYWDTTSRDYFYMETEDMFVVQPSDVMDLFDRIGDGDVNTKYGRSFYLDASSIAGNEHDITVQFQNHIMFDGDSFNYGDIPVFVEIEALSRDLFNYEISALPSDYYDDGFISLFSEPVQVSCNVKGGIGVFGGYVISNHRVREFRFENFRSDY